MFTFEKRNCLQSSILVFVTDFDLNLFLLQTPLNLIKRIENVLKLIVLCLQRFLSYTKMVSQYRQDLYPIGDFKCFTWVI